MLQDELEENMYTYKDVRNLANKIVRYQKRLTEKKVIENLENHKTNPRLFFKKCQSVKKRYKSRTC